LASSSLEPVRPPTDPCAPVPALLLDEAWAQTFTKVWFRRLGRAASASSSVAALAVVVATGVAMASHFSLWHSDILRFKLVVFVLVAVLLALHV
jgi:hypothetical protein